MARYSAYDFLFTIHSNHSPFCTVSKIRQDLAEKQFFWSWLYLPPPLLRMVVSNFVKTFCEFSHCLRGGEKCLIRAATWTQCPCVRDTWSDRIGTAVTKYCLVGWCLTQLSAQIGYIVPWAYEIYIVQGQEKAHSNTSKMKNTHKHSLQPGLCGDNLLTTDRHPQTNLSRQSPDKYWQLNQNNFLTHINICEHQ